MSLEVRSEGKRAKGQSQLDSTQEGTWLIKGAVCVYVCVAWEALAQRH